VKYSLENDAQLVLNEKKAMIQEVLKKIVMKVLNEYQYDVMKIESMKKLEEDVRMLIHHLVMLENHY
jgi:hypothetical protein